MLRHVTIHMSVLTYAYLNTKTSSSAIDAVFGLRTWRPHTYVSSVKTALLRYI